MKLVNVSICLKLYRYRMYVKLVSEKIFTISDDFIVNKVNDFFVENVFNKELTYENLNILMLENDVLLKLFREYIETISDTFRYTYDTEYVDYQLPFVLSNVLSFIAEDIKEKSKELRLLHKDFSTFYTFRMLKDYYAKITYIIRI